MVCLGYQEPEMFTIRSHHQCIPSGTKDPYLVQAFTAKQSKYQVIFQLQVRTSAAWWYNQPFLWLLSRMAPPGSRRTSYASSCSNISLAPRVSQGSHTFPHVPNPQNCPKALLSEKHDTPWPKPGSKPGILWWDPANVCSWPVLHIWCFPKTHLVFCVSGSMMMNTY